MDNVHAFAELDLMLEAIRKTETVNEDAAKECADALRSKTASNIAAQRDPYDHPWPPTKDGAAALQNAMGAIDIHAKGTTIEFTVDGPEARHHIGNARGYHGGSYKKVPKHAAMWQATAINTGANILTTGYRRALIPFASIPGPFKAIIRRVLESRVAKYFKEAA